MKHFIYFSSRAVTSGKAIASQSLMKAGRIDIAIHSFIQAIFLSHDVREDVTFHFIFYGMPDPPKHIEISVKKDQGLPEDKKQGRIDISKKDIAGLIKKLLYKYRPGEKREVLPGCFVEKKSFLKVIQELLEKGNQVFLLDKKGQDIREAKISKDCAFILGDQEGLPNKELKRLKKELDLISIGPKMYFASQTVVLVNNELDRRESSW
jgi:tRNA (pseudouridine54-N1)-methyltransferase